MHVANQIGAEDVPIKLSSPLFAIVAMTKTRSLRQKNQSATQDTAKQHADKMPSANEKRSLKKPAIQQRHEAARDEETQEADASPPERRMSARLKNKRRDQDNQAGNLQASLADQLTSDASESELQSSEDSSFHSDDGSESTSSDDDEELLPAVQEKKPTKPTSKRKKNEEEEEEEEETQAATTSKSPGTEAKSKRRKLRRPPVSIPTATTSSTDELMPDGDEGVSLLLPTTQRPIQTMTPVVVGMSSGVREDPVKRHQIRSSKRIESLEKKLARSDEKDELDLSEHSFLPEVQIPEEEKEVEQQQQYEEESLEGSHISCESTAGATQITLAAEPSVEQKPLADQDVDDDASFGDEAIVEGNSSPSFWDYLLPYGPHYVL